MFFSHHIEAGKEEQEINKVKVELTKMEDRQGSTG
jgi:hypothetical protein